MLICQFLLKGSVIAQGRERVHIAHLFGIVQQTTVYCLRTRVFRNLKMVTAHAHNSFDATAVYFGSELKECIQRRYELMSAHGGLTRHFQLT